MEEIKNKDNVPIEEAVNMIVAKVNEIIEWVNKEKDKEVYCDCDICS